MYGWTGQRLKVYLTEGKIVKEPLPEELRVNYLGGRGLNSKTLFDELKPGIDALSPDNIFMVAAGPLNGTAAPSSSRWTVTAKSALTGGLGDGNGGGDFAAELKFAGYDHIIITGRSEKPVYLYIGDDRIDIREADDLWGRDIYQVTDILRERHSREASVITIGQGGERLLPISLTLVDKIGSMGNKGGERSSGPRT